VAHREWFKKVLFLNKIQDLALEFDFSSINFSNRNSVLKAAKTFEDTGPFLAQACGGLNGFDPIVKPWIVGVDTCL
jgi:hypothetical protein